MTPVNTSPLPRVGVGVIVIREGRVLLGKRKGSHGAGTWALPGGHLEFGETVDDCARREAEEETGLQLKNIRPGPYTNDVMAAEGKHYVTVFVQAVPEAGEPQILEPDKCECWVWFKWSELPQNLFLPLQNLRAQGYVPNEA
jgi:8-oxo-dGTP diphosphatase